MNLFHLKINLNKTNPKNLKINLLEIMHRNTNIVKYRLFSIEAFIEIAITIYLLSSYAFYYQFFALIELFVTSEMSVVFASINCLNETTKTQRIILKNFQ